MSGRNVSGIPFGSKPSRQPLIIKDTRYSKGSQQIYSVLTSTSLLVLSLLMIRWGNRLAMIVTTRQIVRQMTIYPTAAKLCRPSCPGALQS